MVAVDLSRASLAYASRMCGELGLENVTLHQADILATLAAIFDSPLPPDAGEDSFNLLPVPFGTRIRVRIGPPIPRRAEEDRHALLGEARQWIEKALAAYLFEGEVVVAPAT